MNKGKSILASTAPASNQVMQDTITNGQGAASVKDLPDESVRPFRVNISDKQLADLKSRILATQWPDRETVNDNSQGVPLDLLQEVAGYWAGDYDWRKLEKKLNALPQFVANIDGLDIHFVHVRSGHKNALPVIVTHGWPGSVIEQLKIIAPLTDPTKYGGKPEDAFDIVIPSMPGYGFSGKPVTTGWGPDRIARAWITLMRRLGYTRFVAQGGDWGALITELMALQGPPELLGIHINAPGVVPADVSHAIATGGVAPAGMSAEEEAAFDRLRKFFAKEAFYAFEMATRPQTLYGIADSPAGLAAWMIDHGDGHAQPAASMTEALRKPTDKFPESEFTRDDVLDNITLYWLTNTGVSSARLYWENTFPFFDVRNVTLPVAVSAFPGELFTAPRSWAERGYSKLIYYNRPAKGGHYAAWEQPQIFAEEMRAGFKSLR